MGGMTLTDVASYVLAVAPSSIIAVVHGVDNPDTLLAGAGSSAISIIALVSVRLLAAHKEHLAAQRKRWEVEDKHLAREEEHRGAQRLEWQRANENSRDLHAAVGRVFTAVSHR